MSGHGAGSPRSRVEPGACHCRLQSLFFVAQWRIGAVAHFFDHNRIQSMHVHPQDWPARMNLVSLPSSAIRLGAALPFSVYNATGQLLLAKGSVVNSEAERMHLIQRGGYIDETESERFQRALASKLDDLMRQNASLKQLATATPDLISGSTAPERAADPVAVWAELQVRASTLLREHQREDWLACWSKLQADVAEQVETDADAALFILIRSTSTAVRSYSATHALLVAVVCDLAAAHITAWPPSVRQPLRSAALSMNLAMTQLQDRLSQQDVLLNPQQRMHVQSHPARTVALLKTLGVQDPLWLDAVASHHSNQPGPLSAKPLGEQLGRLIQRCDIFSARLSARGKRKAQSATAAAQAVYTDELKQPDETGAAILKAVGLYPPGSFVRLSNSEVALVLARGRRANEPIVASILGREGLALGEPVLRDTRLPAFQTKGGVAPHEVKVMLNMERMLKMR